MPDGVLFRPEYVDLLDGDHVSALMLSQIVYWCSPGKNGKSRLRAFMRGKLCLVKSHQDWWDELRLTRRQTNRCLDVLRAKNFVVTEVHKWQGKPTVHLTLQKSVLDLALAGLHSTVQTVCTTACIPIAPTSANGLHPDVQCLTETTTETTTESTNAIDFVESQEEPTMATAQEILEGLNKKATAPVSGTNTMALVFQWKKQVGLVNEGQFVKPLTQKEVGQLKQVYGLLGEKAIPLLEFVIPNWQKFAQEVQMSKGLQVFLNPDTGFLLKHLETAVQLSAQKSAPVVQVAPTVIKPVVDVPVKAEENPDLATEDDVQATLDALKALKGKS